MVWGADACPWLRQLDPLEANLHVSGEKGCCGRTVSREIRWQQREWFHALHATRVQQSLSLAWKETNGSGQREGICNEAKKKAVAGESRRTGVGREWNPLSANGATTGTAKEDEEDEEDKEMDEEEEREGKQRSKRREGEDDRRMQRPTVEITRNSRRDDTGSALGAGSTILHTAI